MGKSTVRYMLVNAVALACICTTSSANATDRAKISIGSQVNCLSLSETQQDGIVQLIHAECQESEKQVFSLVPVEGGNFNILSAVSGNCLEAVSPASEYEASVILADCNGLEEQMFALKPAERTKYYIASEKGELCLSGKKDLQTENAPVKLLKCVGDPQQTLSLTAAD